MLQNYATASKKPLANRNATAIMKVSSSLLILILFSIIIDYAYSKSTRSIRDRFKSTPLKANLLKSKSKVFKVETLVESDDFYSDEEEDTFDPYGVATDSSGNVYVADYSNNRIRKITPTGSVTTLAGSGTAGTTDGIGTAAQFNYPNAVSVDPNGNVYIADTGNHRIRKITSTGSVTTLAGSTQGFNDAEGTNAKFWSPQGIAVDSRGNVYVADTGNCLIRKIDSNQLVTTLAGNVDENGKGLCSFSNGVGKNAQFNYPYGVAVWNGIVFVADTNNCVIRKINSDGTISTMAGKPPPSNRRDSCGFRDGMGTKAQFNFPTGVSVWNGNVYVADTINRRIRKINLTGSVSTLIASPTGDRKDATAQFCDPWGVAVDRNGNVYVADPDNSKILKIYSQRRPN